MSGPILTSSRGADIRPALGWPLMPVPDGDGRLGWPDLEASIRQRIECVLRTAPGEQLMRPEFGAGLEGLIHQANTTEVRARTQAQIAAAVGTWEPRILLDRVSVVAADDPRELIVTIAYRIRTTGSSGQIAARVPVGSA